MRCLLILLMLVSTSAIAEEKMDVLKIYEQFTLASTAAGKCIKPTVKELTSFLANYQMISVSALTELKKRKTSLTNEQANKILLSGSKKLTNAVYVVIEKEGCDSAKIQDLIKRFHVQASWKP